ncbi:hypothetical protein H5410_047276 [Solanum commersonii]|uniref:Uncharacterized protein n=1 Tax=Solanum commersonii TaxID=4109 RepID=A0A9J5XGN8_SOLCO|nr:hypothetical protein H5410_047276 [Solanum commersonii]
MPLKHPQTLYTIIPLILLKNSHSFCAASIKTYIPVLSSFISSSPLLRFVPSLRAFNFDVADYLQYISNFVQVLEISMLDPGSGNNYSCLKVVEIFGLEHINVGYLLRKETYSRS